MDNLINPTQEAVEFLDKWKNSADYIIAHTSGSTGRPKGIRLKKKDMIVSAEATCRYFNLSSQSIMLCPLSASYIAGKMMIVRALVSDAKLFFEQPSSNPIRHRYPPISLMPIVPAQIESIVKRNQPISNIIVGGAPMSAEQEKQISHCASEAYATYGMTETCSHVALRNLSYREDFYFALPDISFSLDERGCLIIDMPRYSFRRIITNDIVELLDDRHFKWLGRIDNVIISGAHKIHPEQVEMLLTPHISIPFFITSVEDPKWGQKVVICLLGDRDLMTEESLNTLFKEKLPKHQMPREILWLNKFPTTSSGKTIRRLPKL